MHTLMVLTTSKQSRLGTTLENLRTVLQALDRTGDFTNPQIVNLRRLIAERINTLEALKAAGEADYLGSSN